jgi:hypothetical protein
VGRCRAAFLDNPGQKLDISRLRACSGKTECRVRRGRKLAAASETAHDFWEYLEAKATLTTLPGIPRYEEKRA